MLLSLCVNEFVAITINVIAGMIILKTGLIVGITLVGIAFEGLICRVIRFVIIYDLVIDSTFILSV